jgi:hypothetical protein
MWFGTLLVIHDEHCVKNIKVNVFTKTGWPPALHVAG